MSLGLKVDTITFEVLRGVQDQAYWAAAAALAAWVVGLIGLTVNGLGLALIWRQVKLSNAALALAAETSRMAVLAERPWIKIQSGEVGFVPSVSFTHMTVDVALENVGKSPASSVEYWIVQVQRPTEEGVSAALASRPSTVQLLPTLFPGDRYEKVLEADLPHQEHAVVAVVAEYMMAGAAAPFRSSQVLMYRMGPSPDELSVFEFPFRASCPH